MEKAVIVRPEIPENTGFIARLAANFEADLRVVEPGFNLEEARKTASNAQQKLRDAEIFETVEEAVEDLEYVAGTRPGEGTPLQDFEPRKNTSVMIGPESNGLTNQDLELCDTVVHIDTPDYPSLNQSHAAAIIFHGFSRSDQPGMEETQKQKIGELLGETPLKRAIIDSNPSKKRAGEIIQQLYSSR